MELLQRSLHGLGSDITLTLVGASGDRANAMFDFLETQIELFEKRFSRFLPDSELTRVNHQAGKITKISPEFYDLAKTALELSTETEGIFNPFILPELQRAGYVSSWPNPESAPKVPSYETRKSTSAKNAKIRPGWIELPENTALEFGGIGKGYLLNKISELAAQTYPSHWFSLGGDILARESDPEGKPWRIKVAHALELKRVIGTFSNPDGHPIGVATSGVTRRKGVSATGKWHHIIDPRTGQPAITDILTASVYCDNALTADVLAKCAVILGTEKAKDFLVKQKVKGALLQKASGQSGVEIIKIGAVEL